MTGHEDDVIITCRCEDVTRDEILKAIDEGYTTLQQIKYHLRCGMGICQGRRCLRLIAQIIADKTGVPIAEQDFPRVRPPIAPFTLAMLAAAKKKSILKEHIRPYTEACLGQE